MTGTQARSRRFDAGRLGMLVLLLPALAGAGAIVVGEGRSFWRSGVPALSLPDALRNSELDAVAAHLRDGIDPNAAITIADETLTGGRHVEVPPLLVAIASDKEDSVTMLLGLGARLSPRELALATCLSMRRDQNAMVELLDRYAGRTDPSVACPAVDLMREAPLAWFAQASGDTAPRAAAPAVP